MTLALPSDAQIRARAEELQLVGAGEPLPHDVRRTIAKQLLDEAQAAKARPVNLDPVLLSRTTQPALGGLIRVDVLFIPTPPQEGSSS